MSGFILVFVFILIIILITIFSYKYRILINNRFSGEIQRPMLISFVSTAPVLSRFSLELNSESFIINNEETITILDNNYHYV